MARVFNVFTKAKAPALSITYTYLNHFSQPTPWPHFRYAQRAPVAGQGEPLKPQNRRQYDLTAAP